MTGAGKRGQAPSHGVHQACNDGKLGSETEQVRLVYLAEFGRSMHACIVRQPTDAWFACAGQYSPC